MIKELLERFAGKRILVLGDVMLDHYLWGRVERISPEAPVPVLEVRKEEYRLGGAANAALNIRSLGGEALLVGVTGTDPAAADLANLLAGQGLATDGLIEDIERQTTLKTRIGAVNQQIVRIDRETTVDLRPATENKVIDSLRKLLPDCHALLVEDYNKGVMTSEVISAAINLANKLNIPMAVDPKHKNFTLYRGAEIFKPNFRELQTVLGRALDNDIEFIEAARKLRKEMEIKNLIVTRGSMGMYIFAGESDPLHLPTVAKEVYDVSGAGDTVISALVLSYISGAEINLAAEVANHAAGVACGIIGTACVSPEDLLRSYNGQR